MRIAVRVFLISVILCGAVATKNTQARPANFDWDSNLGVYKVLADVALELDRTGDHERAAEVARCIEMMWDGFYDDRQRPGAPRKLFSSPENSEEIDAAMDRFIQPLKAYASKTPDHAAMIRAHHVYVDTLVKTDHIWKQDKNINQTAGVDDTHMGPYRTLAQLSFQAFQKGDNVTAAELARVLERTWDRGESAERAADKPNHDLYNQIDDAMDGFIGPIMNYATKAPDASKVQAAYNDYLEKLKAAD